MQSRENPVFRFLSLACLPFHHAAKELPRIAPGQFRLPGIVSDEFELWQPQWTFHKPAADRKNTLPATDLGAHFAMRRQRQILGPNQNRRQADL